jgi:hypothetical protein
MILRWRKLTSHETKIPDDRAKTAVANAPSTSVRQGKQPDTRSKTANPANSVFSPHFFLRANRV